MSQSEAIEFEPLLLNENKDREEDEEVVPLKLTNTTNSPSCLVTMRKYYKLCLVVVTVFSVVCLLFYKTQYDKLYKVLEVLEFFGSNVEVKDGTFMCASRGFLPWTPPSFQRVNEGHFVYSSFCSPSLDSAKNVCGMIVALAVVKKDFSGDQLRCQLWYEGIQNPMEGMLSAHVHESDDQDKDTFFVELNCENKYSDLIPYGLTLLGKDGEAFVPIEEPIPYEYGPEPLSVGACILPEPTPEDSTFILAENILVNSFFGIKNFYVYSNFATHKFTELLTEAQKQDSLLSAKILPWNPPFKLDPDFTRRFLERDCLLRSRKIWESKVILKAYQILVPKYAKTVGGVMSKLAEPGSVSLSVLRFCSEFPGEPTSAQNTHSLMSLEQTTFDKSLSVNKHKVLHYSMHKSWKKQSSEKEQEMSADKLAIFDFSKCDKLEFEDGVSVKDLFLANMKDQIEEKIGAHFPMKSV